MVGAVSGGDGGGSDNVGNGSGEGGKRVVGEHLPSLRDEMTIGHCESILNITPVTLILAPPLSTQSSIREMRERLSV